MGTTTVSQATSQTWIIRPSQEVEMCEVFGSGKKCLQLSKTIGGCMLELATNNNANRAQENHSYSMFQKV